MLHEFRMPDAGEGLTEAEVLSWRVAVGDVVTVNQVLLEVETAKAAVELPSPYAGTVVELLAQPGDTVPVGTPIIRIDDGAAAGSGTPLEPAASTPTTPAKGSEDGADADQRAGATEPQPTSAQVNAAFGPDFGAQSTPSRADAPGQAIRSATEHPLPGPAEQGSPGGADPPARDTSPADGQRQAVLVGYGVRAEQSPRRRPRATPHGAEHVEPGPPGERARPVRHGGLELARAVEERIGAAEVRAKPPVRRLARDLDVDLAAVVPTGPGGTITHDDVTRAAAALASSDVVPLSHVTRLMARAMTESAFTAPHATEWVDVDVTAMSALIRAARSRPALAELPLTPLTFAALGLVRAVREHPTINASLDAAGENLLVHRSVQLGIAVDSPRGLVVPHIPDAQSLDLRDMAEALGRLVATARAGRSRPEELAGSTITITNVGVFGIDAGTPILNPGEVAILALGRVVPRPWVVDGSVVPRDVVTLALSFDHRVIDGALGARVLRSVADFLADPATALALEP